MNHAFFFADFRRFLVKEPLHSENVSDGKFHLHRKTRAKKDCRVNPKCDPMKKFPSPAGMQKQYPPFMLEVPTNLGVKTPRRPENDFFRNSFTLSLSWQGVCLRI